MQNVSKEKSKNEVKASDILKQFYFLFYTKIMIIILEKLKFLIQNFRKYLYISKKHILK